MKQRNWPRLVYISVCLVFIYLPIFMVVLYSFNESRLSSVWGGFSFKWYGTLFQNDGMFSALQNSLLLATIAGLASGVIGTLGAVGLRSLRGGAGFTFLTTLPIMLPEIILGFVFLVFFSLLGMPFGLATLVIAHTSFGIPYVYLLVKARLKNTDSSLQEAARDLGAGPLRAFFTVTLPLVFPSALSGMLLAFAMSMDDVIISLFVTGPSFNTLPIRIYTKVVKTGATPDINALCTLLLAVTLLLGLASLALARTKKGKENNKI